MRTTVAVRCYGGEEPRKAVTGLTESTENYVPSRRRKSRLVLDAHGGSGAYPSLFKASSGGGLPSPVDYGLEPNDYEVRKRPGHLARVTGPRIEAARRAPARSEGGSLHTG